MGGWGYEYEMDVIVAIIFITGASVLIATASAVKRNVIIFDKLRSYNRK